MANISSVGIGSGVLTSELIEKLVSAEKEPTEKRLKFKEEKVTTELSVFGQIQSAITDLRLPSRALADPGLFQQLNVTSGSSAFSAVASASASAGSYTLEVTTLAKSHSLSTGEFADADSTQVGTGTLSFTVAGQTTDIVIDGSNNTLQGLAAAINESEDLAVSASVIYTGTGYRLVFTSDETGVANQMSIAVTDTGDGDGLDANGLSQLSFTAGGFNLSQNQAATDAAFSLNGIAITRGSNTIDDVLSGVTLTLTGTNEDAAAPLVIKRDTDKIVEKVQEFVDKFNALRDLITEHTKFNPDDPRTSGVLLGDASTRNIFKQMQSILGQSIPGLSGQSVQSVAEVGISTDKNTGQLNFNSSIFLSKYNTDPQSVAALFADQGRTSDGQIEFSRAGVATKVGTYAVEITQIATKGAYSGNVALGGATIIDADNNTFSISVDGTSSGLITLDPGSYTAAALAAHIQSKINSDSALANAGKSVSVGLDGLNQLVISSSIYGGTSTVSIDSVGLNTQAQLGLAVGAGVVGLDVAGTINGVAATGSGQFLTAAAGNDAEGIRLQVNGGAIGSRGNVSYMEGVGEQMVDLINSLLTSRGTITAKNERLNSQLEGISEERVKLNARMESITARLVRQFTAADLIVARLNSTQDFISRQLDALIPSNKKE